MEQLSCQVLKKQNQTSDQFHEMNSVNFPAESLTWHPLTLKCVVVARWVARKHPRPCMAHELILRMIAVEKRMIINAKGIFDDCARLQLLGR